MGIMQLIACSLAPISIGNCKKWQARQRSSIGAAIPLSAFINRKTVLIEGCWCRVFYARIGSFSIELGDDRCVSRFGLMHSTEALFSCIVQKRNVLTMLHDA